jgi:hypothetical protein
LSVFSVLVLATLAMVGQGSSAPGGDREGAIASIHQRASAVVPGTPAARQLARELAEIGRAFLSEGGPAGPSSCSAKPTDSTRRTVSSSRS